MKYKSERPILESLWGKRVKRIDYHRGITIEGTIDRIAKYSKEWCHVYVSDGSRIECTLFDVDCAAGTDGFRQCFQLYSYFEIL
jgi:hypothetical protein